MPTYDYECSGCGHEFETFQSITAKPLRKCPSCGTNRLQRLLGTGGGVIFKGSGFYQTDYRTDSYKKAAEKEKPSTDNPAVEKTETKTQDKATSQSPSKQVTQKSNPPKD